MNTETLLLLIRLTAGTGLVYLFYILLLKKRADGQISRFFLLAGTLLFTVLPFWPAAESSSENTTYLLNLPEIAAGEMPTGAEEGISVSWMTVIYITGVGLTFLLFMVKMARLLRLRIKGRSYTENGLYITETGLIRYPFSFARRIFLPEGMETETRALVLAHETVHIRHAHTADLLFFELLKMAAWFNPFYYLLEKELRQAHEFTADETVLRSGVSTGAYCEALLSCALAGMQVPVNYFNGSQIKMRINMMNKPKNKNRIAFLASAILSLGAVAFTGPYVLGQTGTQKVYNTVEQMPEFPGGNEGLAKYMLKTVRYPAKAQEEELEGRVMVGFVVDAQGKVTDAKVEKSLSPETDAEALRAVKAMPDWKPGQQDGKPVSVKFLLPVTFKLG